MTIGIAITAYNRDRYLSMAVDSVMRQTHSDWRLVIVDDGSTDQTATIAEGFAALDPRITVLRQDNHGCGHALSLGLGVLAQDCEYLGWVDSDDVLNPIALQVTKDYLDSDRLSDCIYTHYQVIDSDGGFLRKGRRCEIPYSPERLLTDFMVFHFRLLRSVAYRAIGGVDADLKAAIDYDLMLRFSERFEIACLPEVLYSYRQHSQSLSALHRQQQAKAATDAANRALLRRGMEVAA